MGKKRIMIRHYVTIILACCLGATLLLPNEAFAAKAKKKRKQAVKREYQVSANSAILINLDNNKRYYARDIEQRVAPASTTKVMTALLVLEKLSLDDYVTVSSNAQRVQPTKLGVLPGEQYKVRDLLYALLLKSANDVAIVLAEAVAGSEADFVAMMNERAKAIGAKHTNFANPHGLPDNDRQYTTAYDMVLILNEALKNAFFRQAITFKYRAIYSKDGRRLFVKSHNKALFLGWKRNIYGKTGYTQEAQSCFVGYIPRGNERLMVAVFGCRKRWDDIKFIVERYGKIDL